MVFPSCFYQNLHLHLMAASIFIVMMIWWCPRARWWTGSLAVWWPSSWRPWTQAGPCTGCLTYSSLITLEETRGCGRGLEEAVTRHFEWTEDPAQRVQGLGRGEADTPGPEAGRASQLKKRAWVDHHLSNDPGQDALCGIHAPRPRSRRQYRFLIPIPNPPAPQHLNNTHEGKMYRMYYEKMYRM